MCFSFHNIDEDTHMSTNQPRRRSSSREADRQPLGFPDQPDTGNLGATDPQLAARTRQQIHADRLVASSTARAASEGDRLSFSWAYVPAGTNEAPETWHTWTGTILYHTSEGSVVRYDPSCYGLAVNEQLFPPELDSSGDVRLRDVRTIRTSFPQRNAPPRPPAPRQSDTRVQAQTTTPTITELQASRFFVAIIAAASGHWSSASDTNSDWTAIRAAMGQEFFDQLVEIARSSHSPEENEQTAQRLREGGNYIDARQQEAYLAATRAHALWPILEVIITRIQRELPPPPTDRRRAREEPNQETVCIDEDDIDELIRNITPAARRRLETIFHPPQHAQQQVAESFIDASRGTATIQLCPGVRVSMHVSAKERVWSPWLHTDQASWQHDFNEACLNLRIAAVSKEAAQKLNSAVDIYGLILSTPFPGLPGTREMTREHWNARILSFEAVVVNFIAAYVGSDAGASIHNKHSTAWTSGRYEPALLVSAALLPGKKEVTTATTTTPSTPEVPLAAGKGVNRFIEQIQRGRKGGKGGQ